jgi:hypothetical protein
VQQVYQKGTEEASRALATLFEAHPEAMAPLLNIVVEAKVTLDAFSNVVGRSCLETVLQLSAAEIAGPPHPPPPSIWSGAEAGATSFGTAPRRAWSLCPPRRCG